MRQSLLDKEICRGGAGRGGLESYLNRKNITIST